MFSDTYKLKLWLQESFEHFEATKKFGRLCREYLNGDQLDPTIKQILANRGQPELWENNISKHNNAILGFKKDRITEIKLLGNQQSDKPTADILNAIIRAITELTDYKDEMDICDETLTVEGIAVSEIKVEGNGSFDRFGREHKDIKIIAKDVANVFLDPMSKARNYNDDARHISEAFWVDKEDLYSIFDHADIDNLSDDNFLSDVYEDDMTSTYYDRRRVLLVYTWYKEYDKKSKKNRYYYCFWSGNTILLQKESPYEFDGFPYAVEFMHKDFRSKVKYWGLYKDIMPLQDSINYAKLRMQNMIGTSKLLIEEDSLLDDDEGNPDIYSFQDEYSRDDAVVMVKKISGTKEITQNNQIQHLLQTIVDNRNQISELLGVNKEVLGTANNRMSAVAQESRINSGLVGLSKFLGKSENISKSLIQKMIKLIEQYYDTERVINIVDEDYMQDFLTINQTIQNDHGGISYDVLEDGKVVPIATNKIVAGKYDLIYLSKPKPISGNAERYRQNVELIKVLQSTDPGLVKYIVPELLKDSESPSAKKIRDIIYSQTEQDKNDPAHQQQLQLQNQIQAQDIMYKNSMIVLNHAKADAMTNKNKIDLQKAFSNAAIAKENIRTKQQKIILQR